MKKILFISGSPRKAGAEYVLRKVMESTGGELVLLRKLDIRHCTGCLECEKDGKCVIDDEMQELYKKMEKADVLVIGSPNYFDNVPGLLKDFIDRTNTFYNSDKLKGKKAVFIVVGGGSSGDANRVADQALTYFANGTGLDIVGKFVFSGTDKQAVKEMSDTEKRIKEIAELINSFS